MKKQTILMVGGGTGGHVSPIISLVQELESRNQKLSLEFWTDRKQYKNLKDDASLQRVKLRAISAGKLRRYATFPLLEYLRHPILIMKNLLDTLKIAFALLQSFWRLSLRRPKMIFLKGGFVCLPVGLVAGFLRIPYIIHESDSVPGLTNRLLMKRAQVIATGMPVECYKEFQDKMIWTGVPIGEGFRVYSEDERKALRQKYNLDSIAKIVVVTGGSQGSKNLNEVSLEIWPQLAKHNIQLVLITGKRNYKNILAQREGLEKADSLKILDYSERLWELFGLADVVVSRSGASTLMNLVAAKKPAILVPYQKLPGGHQVRNAELFARAGAAEMLIDKTMLEQPQRLAKMLIDLAFDKKMQEQMCSNLSQFARQGATQKLADLILAQNK